MKQTAPAPISPTCLVCLLVIAAVRLGAAAPANLLVNPSFERDDDADGLPDGWGVHKDARGRLIDGGSDGEKAVAFTEGYVVLEQNLALAELADKNFRLDLDARSEDGAQLGAMVGHLRVGKDGKATWRNRQLAWDRSLSKEYTTFRLRHRIPTDARGERLWVAIYRSNNAGTLIVDNVKAGLNDLSADEQTTLNRIEREWRYLHRRAQLARDRLGDNAEVMQALTAAKEVQDRCFAADRSVLTDADALDERLGELSARINRAVMPEADLAVASVEPYSRLAPEDLAPERPPKQTELLALPGEHHAVGVMLASGRASAQEVRLAIRGLPAEQFACQVRRQVFLETWYRREDTRLADPLPLLPSADGVWTVKLAPGEIAKLYLAIHCTAGPTRANATILVESSSGESCELPVRIAVLADPIPKETLFGHLAFIYPSLNTAGHSPELTAADLGAHYVNRMEFPSLPPCEFSPEGELLKADFSRHEAWLKAYCPQVAKMLLFWPPTGGEFKCADGTTLALLRDPWKRAFVSLFRAFFEHAEKLGYGKDRFAILPYDEPHSANLDASPDESIANAVEVMKLCRHAFPDLEIVLTISYYAFPKDVAAVAPYLDVAVPHWPYVTELRKKYAPPTYNPRQAFADSIWPTLVAERERRGTRLWSYHVAGGKSDDVLLYNRAYPLRAVGAGQTGVATWAYNVSRGSTWDDADGGGVDYTYVYDGREDHPLNRQYNPVGEIVVPSIRWEALRAGIQEARLLLYLRDAAGTKTCPPSLRTDIEHLFRLVEAMASDNRFITWETVANVSRQARTLYARNR